MILVNVLMRCNMVYLLLYHFANLHLRFINNRIMCSDSSQMLTPYRASTYASHPNLHEHERIRCLSNDHVICSYSFWDRTLHRIMAS
jgi:hypothetical protein